MFGCEALLDINHLVCCLMKIHVPLKRVVERAWRIKEVTDGVLEGQEVNNFGGRDRQSDNVVEHLFVLQVTVPLNATL